MGEQEKGVGNGDRGGTGEGGTWGMGEGNCGTGVWGK